MPSSAPIPGRCGARLRKKPGQYCGHWPLKGRTRCRLHGGASLAGPASGTWDTGKFSKYLPTDLAERYDRHRRDPKLLEMREHVAIVDSQLERLLEQWAKGGTPAEWKQVFDLATELQDACGEFTAAQRARNEADMKAAFRAIADLVGSLGALAMQGIKDARAWRDIANVMTLGQQLRDGEKRREREDAIPAVKALAAFGHLAAAISRIVTNPNEKRLLAQALREFFMGTVSDGKVIEAKSTP